MFSTNLPVKPLFPAIAEKEIVAFEKSIGYQLPNDYRLFLQQHNGIQFDLFPRYAVTSAAYKSKFELSHSTVEILYGIADPLEQYSILDEGRRYDFAARVPDHVICIGRCGEARPGRIAISVGGADCGSVYIFLSSLPWEEEGEYEQTTDELYKVAESFAAFWSMIEVNPKWID